MTHDIQSLQPWQIFCSMFAVFWLVTAWLDQVLITLVLCIVFGVVSDIVTKNMYSDSKEDGQTAVEEKKEKVEELNVDEIKANNEKIWSQAEAEKEKEEEAAGVPPPLPGRDYQSGQDMDSLADKLTAVAASSEAADSEEEEQAKEEDVPMTRQYNRTVSDEYNQNTSTIDFNQRVAVIEEEAPTSNETLDEDPIEVRDENKLYAKDSSDEEEEEEDKKIFAKDSSDEDEKKVYAKDSSDDDDYDYASREVNFDEDESETEEDSTEGSKKEDETPSSNDEIQSTENKTLQETKDDFKEDKEKVVNEEPKLVTQDAMQKVETELVKEEPKLVTQDAMQKVETELEHDEPKKENTTINDLKEYMMEDHKDSFDGIKDGVKVTLDEPKKENTTIQDLKEYMMEDQKDSFNGVKDDVKVTQDAMQEVEQELKLEESKKEEKDDMLSTFEDLKPEMKSVDDLVTF